jgi:hypothetical protein
MTVKSTIKAKDKEYPMLMEHDLCGENYVVYDSGRLFRNMTLDEVRANTGLS